MTDKELRTLDEMLTNLEIWSTWNKTFANEMIGICSKMRNLLADRKTENSSEIPNNCEDEFFREPTAEERKAVADYIDSISVPTGVNIFDLMDEPQTERSE